MHVESINSYTTVVYMVLGLASLYQCADCEAPINQSMSDEVKMLIFLLATTFDRVLHVSANYNVCTRIPFSMCVCVMSTLIPVE